MQRNELAVRATAVGLDPTTIPNDSKLEQKVLYLEKRQTAITGTAPTTTLTSTGVAVDAETLTLGGTSGSRVYTFKTALTGAANEVLIGAAATNTLDNLKDAINGTTVSGGPGTTYGTGTKRNADFTAGTKTATTLVIASTDTNANGSAATTETMTNFSFTGSTMSAGTLGSIASATSTTAGAPGLSGDKNTTL
jgi:hypothetical protein